jgi:hypothetical protein
MKRTTELNRCRFVSLRMQPSSVMAFVTAFRYKNQDGWWRGDPVNYIPARRAVDRLFHQYGCVLDDDCTGH